MSKYTELEQYLENLDDDVWVAPFKDIEDILGFPLPRSAYQYQAWWSNQSMGHSQTSAWRNAGWKTSQLDLKAQEVTFLKSSSSDTEQREAVRHEFSHLTIAEAKAGLAKTFGVPVDSIDITIKG